MPVKCDEYGSVCVLALDGDLSGAAGGELRRAADERIVKRQSADVVVDLRRAAFIDGEGLESLLWLKRRCEDRAGRLMLAGLDANCRTILDVTRLAHRFESYPEVAAAMRAMR